MIDKNNVFLISLFISVLYIAYVIHRDWLESNEIKKLKHDIKELNHAK